MTDIDKSKQSVVLAAQRLLKEGLVARTWGNVSCRVDGDRYAITPSGMGYEHMTKEDIVLYDMQSKSYEGKHKPSGERGIHTAAYRRFPDARFLIHTHQTYATAVGLAGFDSLPLTPQDEELLGGVARASYGLPSTNKLVRAVDAALETGARTVLMANHGVLIVGNDPEEAFARAAHLEGLCGAVCVVPAAQKSIEISELARDIKIDGAVISYSDDPAVIAASLKKPIAAQLDDMAQMVGRLLPIAEPNSDAIRAALSRSNAVLVRGAGAVLRADTDGDAAALRLLIQKACVCKLHADACGVNADLSLFDTLLMRFIYKKKYEKKIGDSE